MLVFLGPYQTSLPAYLSTPTCCSGTSSGRWHPSSPLVSLTEISVRRLLHFVVLLIRCLTNLIFPLIDSKILMILPELYRYGREQLWFGTWPFAIYMLEGVYQVCQGARFLLVV